MAQALDLLLDTSGFPPRWTCGSWTPVHGWTHIAADVATFAAYFAIPAVILVYVRRRPGVQFPALFWLFAAFILSCGTVHLVEATLFWQPWYRLSALIKVVTAVVSWITVLALIQVFPLALRLPGLATVNTQLERENERRRRIEAELRRSNEELDKFAYVASHDLKAPLRGISMLADWTEDDAPDGLPEVSRQHLVKLRDRVHGLERLLDDLLLYSRASRTADEPEEVDVAELVRGVVEMVAPPPGFEVVTEGELPVIQTLRSALERVLLNLIANAIEHHDRATGRVAVSGETRAGEVELRVEDDGPGIPPEHRERVFEMFQTLRPRSEGGGSGMGLAIIRKIVQTHGGQARIEDAVGQDGRGTRIAFTWTQLQPAGARP